MITHVLADGREVDSIEGFVIPPTGPTEAVYRIVAGFLEKRQQVACSDKEDRADATA